jgi:hypothetical protein
VTIAFGELAIVKLTPTIFKQAHACPKLARPKAGVHVSRRQGKHGAINQLDLLEQSSVEGGAGSVGP